MSIHLLLIDNQALLRRLLASRLKEEPDLVVTGEAGDGRFAVELALHCKPDIVVTELRLPGCTGVEVGERIRSRRPHTQIIILTAMSELTDLGYLTGAYTCLSKSCTPEELCATIRRTYRSIVTVRSDLGEDFQLKLQRLAEAHSLSEQEGQVLYKTVRTDLTYRQIAHELFHELGTSITPSGVMHTLDRVFTKLAVHPRTRAALVKRTLGGSRRAALPVGSMVEGDD